MKEKKGLVDYLFEGLLFFIFITMSIVCIYPFYYLIINSISANDLSASGQIIFFPKEIHFKNYIEVIKLEGLLRATYISVMRTVIGATCTVLATAFFGYMFTLDELPFRKILYRYVIITMYFNAGLIPFYMSIRNLNLHNSFWVYILPAIVQPFNVILVKTFIESTPKALQEAAKIDGANFFQIFTKVIFPISKPILATIAIFAAVGQWNSFQDTLLFITDKNLYTLQYVLQQFVNQASSLATLVKNVGNNANIGNLATQQTPTSIRMTVAVIVVLPILFVYPIFQKHFVKGIMIGSIKE